MKRFIVIPIVNFTRPANIYFEIMEYEFFNETGLSHHQHAFYKLCKRYRFEKGIIEEVFLSKNEIGTAKIFRYLDERFEKTNLEDVVSELKKSLRYTLGDNTNS